MRIGNFGSYVDEHVDQEMKSKQHNQKKRPLLHIAQLLSLIGETSKVSSSF